MNTEDLIPLYALGVGSIMRLPPKLARAQLEGLRVALILGDGPTVETCVSAPLMAARKSEQGAWDTWKLDDSKPWALPESAVETLQTLGLVAVEPAAPSYLPEKSRKGRHPRKRDAAEAFLRELLKAGPLEVVDIRAQATAAGITRRTLQRARDGLAIRTTRKGMPPRQRFFWHLPEHDGAGLDVEDLVDETFGPLNEG